MVLDEAVAAQEVWASAPRYVSIALTDSCELRCPVLYAPETSARLETARVLAWVRELDAAGCLGVGFGGGEPTAHPQFVEICARAAAATDLAITRRTFGPHSSACCSDFLVDLVHAFPSRLAVDAERGRDLRPGDIRFACLTNGREFGPVDLVSNLVALGSTVQSWSAPFTPIQIVVDNLYFCPIGNGYPKEPPNYLGFRWNGRLQQICHVDGYKVLASCVQAAIDLLLPATTIREARDKTQERLDEQARPSASAERPRLES